MNSSVSASRVVLWMAWMIASVFYAYQYILRVMPNILLNDIMHQFQIDAAKFGQISGFYYIGYSLLHLPIGIMFDRYGPKKVMSGSILLTVIGLSPLVLATHWIYPLLGRFLVGLGSSAAILGVFKIIRISFKEAQFARMLSLSVMIGLIGAIYGGGPVNYMLGILGYKTVVYLFGVVGIVLALITYFLIPNIPPVSSKSVFSDVREVLRNGKVIWSCLFAGLMVGPLEGFADVWGSAFLKQVFGFEGALAASLPSIIFVGMCFGAPFLNFFAEKVGNYLLTIVGAAIVMTFGFLLLLINGSWTPTLVIFNFSIIGICCAYQVLAVYKVSTYVREETAGLTTAIANMIIMIFGYVFHTIMGEIINRLGGPTTSCALFYGVGVIPIALCLGMIGFIFLWIQERKLQKIKEGALTEIL